MFIKLSTLIVKVMVLASGGMGSRVELIWPYYNNALNLKKIFPSPICEKKELNAKSLCPGHEAMYLIIVNLCYKIWPIWLFNEKTFKALKNQYLYS